MAQVKEKAPAEALRFFNPTNKYMGHFFHMRGDNPTMVVETKKNRSGETREKATFQTKGERLYLSDVDAILKKHMDLKGRHSFEDISLGVLSTGLLDQLESQHLNINDVITWAKKEATEKLAAKATQKVVKSPLMSATAKSLVKILATLAPNLCPEDLKAVLLEMVADEKALNEAVHFLTLKEKELGRDRKTHMISLRRRS